MGEAMPDNPRKVDVEFTRGYTAASKTLVAVCAGRDGLRADLDTLIKGLEPTAHGLAGSCWKLSSAALVVLQAHATKDES